MKGTSLRQDEDFKKSIFSSNDFLEESIKWIGKNMNPDDVFDDEKLKNWAEENDFIHTSKIHER